MSTVQFYVSRWPSKDLLLDSIKYGDDPKRKFRIELTVRHHSLEKTVKIGDVEVLGYQRLTVATEIGWVKLTLRLHKDFDYFGHVYRREIVYAVLPMNGRNRRTEGTLELHELP